MNWIVSFPKEMLQYSRLLDAFAGDAKSMLIVDSIGLEVLDGVIPEPHERPEFSPRVVWLHRDGAVKT